MDDLVKKNLRSLVREIFSPAGTDTDSNKIVAAIKSICPDPNFLDYIFWGKRHGIDEALPLEDLISAALEKADTYKPTVLIPPKYE